MYDPSSYTAFSSATFGVCTGEIEGGVWGHCESDEDVLSNERRGLGRLLPLLRFLLELQGPGMVPAVDVVQKKNQRDGTRDITCT